MASHENYGEFLAAMPSGKGSGLVGCQAKLRGCQTMVQGWKAANLGCHVAQPYSSKIDSSNTVIVQNDEQWALKESLDGRWPGGQAQLARLVAGQPKPLATWACK